MTDDDRAFFVEQFTKLHRRIDGLERAIPYTAYILTHPDAQTVIEAMRQYAAGQSFRQPYPTDTMKVPD